MMDILDSYFILNGAIPPNAVGGEYQPLLVLLSYIIAVLGTFTAIAVLRQIDMKSRSSLFWGRILGSVVMGAGIWSMHFTGMLSFKMNIAHTYNGFLTVCSMLAATLFSYAVFYSITRPTVTLLRFYLTAILMGVGISVMHYMAMGAMQMDGTIKYMPSLFLLSIMVAIALSILSMRFMRFILQKKKDNMLLYLLVALIMGLAICSLHYIGMEAAVFIPFNDKPFVSSQTVPLLASSVIVSSIIIIATTFIILFAQRRTLTLIKEERRFIQSIIDAIPDPIFVKDYLHRWVAGNKSFWNILGDSEKYIGTNDRDLFPPEQVDVFWAKDDEVIKNGIININEEHITCADGHTILSLTTKSPLKMLDGTQGLVGVIHDIGLIKAVEQSLKAANQFKETMLEASKYAIVSTDVSGTIQTINPAVQSMLAYNAEEMRGRLNLTAFHADEELVQCAKKLSLEQGRIIEPGFEVFTTIALKESESETEWTYIRKDGSTFSGSLSLSTLYKDKLRTGQKSYSRSTQCINV
jgi:PAS domain S-box-containing protein